MQSIWLLWQCTWLSGCYFSQRCLVFFFFEMHHRGEPLPWPTRSCAALLQQCRTAQLEAHPEARVGRPVRVAVISGEPRLCRNVPRAVCGVGMEPVGHGRLQAALRGAGESTWQ